MPYFISTRTTKEKRRKSWKRSHNLGGFGSLFVSGERSREGQTFFAHRILAFSPERRRRRFHLPLRQSDFYEDRALCRDVRRKLEFWLDPAVLHTLWDPHLESVETFADDQDGGGCDLCLKRQIPQTPGRVGTHHWETALPSRLTVTLPADFQQQVEAARTTYHRFGQYSRALDQSQLCLEHRAMETTELERMCSGLRIPGDFDVA